MTLLTRVREYFKRRRAFRKVRNQFFYAGLDYFKRQIETADRAETAASELARTAAALERYLMAATQESETNRKVVEAKVRRDEDNAPSRFDELY